MEIEIHCETFLGILLQLSLNTGEFACACIYFMLIYLMMLTPLDIYYLSVVHYFIFDRSGSIIRQSAALSSSNQ